MDLPQARVEAVLREKLRERLKPRGYRDFDRRIGKGESGWTSKFLRGERALTLETLLVVLADLDIHPADLLEEAFPRSSVDAAVQGYMGEFERQMREIARQVYRELKDDTHGE
jgi:hypothetical protein